MLWPKKKKKGKPKIGLFKKKIGSIFDISVRFLVYNRTGGITTDLYIST